MAKTVTYRSFNVGDISFAPPKVSKDNNKAINIHYLDGNVRFIQTPKDTVPFDPYDSNFCFTVNDEFKTKIKEIDDYLVSKMVENSVAWFGVQKTEGEVRECYVSILTQNNPDYPPFMRINFSNNNEIYSVNNQITDKSDIKSRCTVKLIIKLGKLYIRAKDDQAKLIIYLEQAKLFETEKVSKLKSYAFIDE